MGETRVDLLHLLEDLRDAYPGAIEETILTEIVANALDSGARAIRFLAGSSTLTVFDDGCGMTRRELARYHDVAATTKTRGQGIGFAGVGIKLGLLISSEVVTETRRGKTHYASRWHLASRHRAPWKWVPPPGAVSERGTAVRLSLTNPLSPLLDPGFIEASVRRHYQPLLDARFESILAPHYRHGVRFEIGGMTVAPERPPVGEVAPLEVRLARKHRPSAVGYLLHSPAPLPEEARGIAISTLGKVIRRGWDWLGITPTAPDRVAGLIEVPSLAESLTLNKADFIRTGARGATYLAYRKAVQERVSRQLALWGDARDTGEESRRRAARPVERDLERVLVDLADDFPLLATLVERREGGQRRLPIGRGGASDARALVAQALVVGAVAAGPEATRPDQATAVEEPPTPTAEEAPRPEPPADLTLPGTQGERRPARYGLTIQYESREGDPEPGRLVDSTVWVNEAHPAYVRAVFSRSEGYHLALAVALALAPLAVEAEREHEFVTTFLERWGSALASPRKRR